VRINSKADRPCKTQVPDNGPESFAGFPTFEVARTLRDEAVNHHKAHRLFSPIVGGADAGRGDEIEVGLAVRAKALGHVERFLLLFLAVFVQTGGNVVARQSSVFLSASDLAMFHAFIPRERLLWLFVDHDDDLTDDESNNADHDHRGAGGRTRPVLG